MNQVTLVQRMHERVVRLWADELGADTVGGGDDFFELGGSSLMAVRLVQRMSAECLPVTLADVFEFSTINGLLGVLGLAGGSDQQHTGARVRPPLGRRERPESVPLSFAQQRLWFIDRPVPGSAPHHMPRVQGISGYLDVPALGRALTEVVARHEVLRTRYAETGRLPYQVVEPPTEVPLPVDDLTGVPAPERDGHALRLVAFAHQDLPFEQLVQRLRPERDLRRHPLVQVTFQLMNAPTGSFSLAGTDSVPFRFDRVHTDLALQCRLFENLAGPTDEPGIAFMPGDLGGVLVGNAALFDQTTLDRWAGHFPVLLSALLAPSDAPVSTVSPMTAQEERDLLDAGHEPVAALPVTGGDVLRRVPGRLGEVRWTNHYGPTLGGHSLGAPMLVARIRERLGHELLLIALFENRPWPRWPPESRTAVDCHDDANAGREPLRAHPAISVGRVRGAARPARRRPARRAPRRAARDHE